MQLTATRNRAPFAFSAGRLAKEETQSKMQKQGKREEKIPVNRSDRSTRKQQQKLKKHENKKE